MSDAPLAAGLTRYSRVAICRRRIIAAPDRPQPGAGFPAELFERPGRTAIIHAILAYAALAFIGLHVAGALKHHFDGHRHQIGRTAPWAWRGEPRLETFERFHTFNPTRRRIPPFAPVRCALRGAPP
jgi:hypothetical protein